MCWTKTPPPQPYRAKLGILGLVGVVVQSDEVEPGFHLVTLTPKHVITTLTLAGLGGTAAEGRALSG